MNSEWVTLLNLKQTEGIDPAKIPANDAYDHDFNPVEVADNLINNWTDKPKIEWDGDSAYYWPAVDTVCIPDQRTFFKDEQFYSTLFHELIHSVGHSSRLARHEKIKDHKFGSQDYSQEELCCEMGAAYLCGLTDMEQETIENNAAYIKSWIRTFKDDPKVLVLAAAQAQKSVDYILTHQADPAPVNSENETEYETNGAPVGALAV